MGRRLFLVAVLAMLMLPAVLAPWGVDQANHRPDAYRAVLAQEPVAWLEERLALRTAMITLRSRALAPLGESGSEQVVRGAEGFLFYADTLANHQGNDEMYRTVAERLAALQSALAAEDRRLLVLIAPDKQEIYPEYLPYWTPVAPDSELARAQAALQQAGVAYLDAFAALTATKAAGPVYFAGDSHWNARGALAVYQTLAEALPEGSWSAYEGVAFAPGNAGDLLLLCQPGASPMEPDAVPQLERRYRALRPIRTMDDMRIATRCGEGGLSLLMVRDSFGEGLFPYLANSDGSLTYSRVYESIPQQARDAGAQVVVVEIVQRNLGNLATADLLGGG